MSGFFCGMNITIIAQMHRYFVLYGTRYFTFYSSTLSRDRIFSRFWNKINSN
jgi:hypothetical protein